MNNKLIALLVTATLQLAATAAQAQVGSCDIVGNNTSANAATPVSTGPLNPVNGFPEYVTDSNGVSLQRCLGAGPCIFDPIVETDAYSLQIGSGGEAFYWNTTAQVVVPGGKRVLTLVMAAETAFLQQGPNGEPINGSQTAFLRLRFTMDVPVAGTYTVRYPYGTEVFTVETARANRDITHTIDRGFDANSTALGSVGPFLREIAPPEGYLGSAVEPGNEVIGSPCNRNSVEITGVDELGNPVDWGNGITSVTTNLFTVMGKFHDGIVQTPLTPTRLTYSRGADGSGQIETFAASTPNATVTVQDGPTIPLGTSRIPNALTMDHMDTRDSLVVPVQVASSLPPILSMTSTDAGTDPTTLNLSLVDFVDITLAEYNQDTGQLSVAARSGDGLGTPRLNLRDYADFAPGSEVIHIFTKTPPAVVHVDSASGGTATAQVRVQNTNTPPTSPAALNLLAISQSSLELEWTDRATTEDGFRVVASATGLADVIVSVPPNTTSATLTGLTANTTYTLHVEAFNHIGAERSGDLIVATLAPPAGPALVNSTLAAAGRAVNVNWVSSPDATGYHVYRQVNGVATLVSGDNALPQAQLSFVDSGVPVNTAVTYQVATVRTNRLGTDVGQATDAATLQTPALPVAPTGVRATQVAVSSVAVAWTDAANDETSYRVLRSSNGGAYVNASAVLAPGVTNFTDSNVTPGDHTYQVEVTNWAGTTRSTTGASVTIAELLAAQATGATVARNPVVSFTDNSLGESGHRIVRLAYRVDDTSGAIVLTGSQTVTELGGAISRGTRLTYTDSGTIANLTYRYQIAALSGTIEGPTTLTPFTVATAGGLPRSTTPFATVALGTTSAQVALRWTALSATSVGGYRVMRCRAAAAGIAVCATGSTLTPLSGNAVNTAGTVDGRLTTTFTDSTVQRNTNYVYFISAVGGAGTGLVGLPSLTGKAVTVR
jgi:hypothetical protein